MENEFNGQWSFAVNRQFDLAAARAAKLRWLAEQLLPDLSDQEWQLVLNAYAGTARDELEPQGRYRIASDVMDDHGIEILDGCEPEFQAAIRKLAGLSQAQQFAVAQFINWFWSESRTGGTLEEFLEQFRASAT